MAQLLQNLTTARSFIFHFVPLWNWTFCAHDLDFQAAESVRTSSDARVHGPCTRASGFHYRVDGPSWRVSKNAPEFSGRQLGPWTRAVNSGSGNRPLRGRFWIVWSVRTKSHSHADWRWSWTEWSATDRKAPSDAAIERTRNSSITAVETTEKSERAQSAS